MSLPETFGEFCADQSVAIMTSDGKVLVGTLKGIDKNVNIILHDSHERVFSTDQGVEKHHLGLCVIRGENVAMIGHIDRELDINIDFEYCRAKPLKSITHGT